MGIQIGSSLVTNIFTAETTRDNNGFIISGSVLGLDSGSYTNGRYWTSSFTNSVVVEVDNYPLASGSNGRWQFNGTDDDIFLTSSITDALPFGTNAYGQQTQVFTALIYGTIGSLNTIRALFGTQGGYNGGGDAILRTDSGPPGGKIHLDNRSPAGETHRFTITGTSGSLLNLAIVARSNGSQSVYQDGVLVASSGSQISGWKPFSGSSYFGFNSDVDTNNYNGQLGGFYLYGREMSAAEISQSAQAFYKGNTFGTTTAISASAVFVGSENVYPYVIPTTTTTTAAPLSVMTLVVGGGGQGGCGTGGGGGAGGVVYSSSLSLLPGTYAANVASGGNNWTLVATAVSSAFTTQSGGSGGTSSFQSGSVNVIAFGGGGGASFTAIATPGGSGGGGSNPASYRTAAAGTTGMGFSGTTVTSDQGCGGGGGGASQTATFRNRAPGGSGSAYTLRAGSSVFYGGGGGAGDYNTDAGGEGGVGGGGAGGTQGVNLGAGIDGTINTGGGGGGGNRNVAGTANGKGGNGGSGIIVIAYLTSSFSASAATAVSGGIITDFTSGSAVYRSHTFLSSSNLVIS